MKLLIAILLTVGALIGFYVIGDKNIPELPWHTNSQGSGHSLMVYKSPTCGCCDNWVTYMRSKGLRVEYTDVDNIDSIKHEKGVPHELNACHTTVVNDGQYFIEGHVPEEAIAKLLEEEPEIKGIGMPGMPMASPGMPGEKMELFDISQVSESGKISSYMRI